MKHPVALILGLSLALAPASAILADDSASTLSADQTAQIDAIGRASVAGRLSPGVTIGIVKHGAIVYARGFGYRNIEDGVPADGRTRYPIGSNTKQFTATCILMLRDAGKLKLDAPLATYLPEIPHAKDVTIRNLLMHTGGYSEYTAIAGFDQLGNRPSTPANVVGTVDAHPLDFKPGTKRSYSNTGFMLLEMVVERLSGMRFADFLQRRIFRPAGMTSTYLRTYDETFPNVATEYESFTLGPWEKALHIDYSWFGGPGAIVSNVADLAKWNVALANGSLIKKADYVEMTTPHRIDDHFPDYGFAIENAILPNGHHMIFHGGNTTGAATQDARFPDDDLSIIVLANNGSYSYDVAVGAIYAALVPATKPVHAPKAPKAPTADPKLIAKAKAWLENAIAGRIDLAKLRPDARARMTPEHRAAFRALAARGPRTYTLIGTDRRAPTTSYEFLLKTSTTLMAYVYATDDDGTIPEAGVIQLPVFTPPAKAAPGASPAPTPMIVPSPLPSP